MSQLTQTIRRPFAQTAPAAILVALAAIAVIAVLVVLMASSLRGGGTRSAIRGSEVDGWMPGITAANAARLDRQAQGATDGWAPALTSASDAKSDRLASEVTDGWAGSLLK